MAKVAIVGGGAAGVGAAIALTKAGMDVSLFEAEARLGGHCFGVSVSLWDRRTIRVDAGVSDFNPATFGSFCELMGELDLRSSPVSQDVSFMAPDRATVWFSRAGQPHIRRRLDDERTFLDDIDRFNRTCLEVLDDATYADWSAQRYLDEKQYSGEFRRFYFDPRAQGDFSMPDKPPDQYRIRSLVNSWRMHGVVGPGSAERMAVQGGMHAYCEAVERWLRERKVALYLSTQVLGITRPGDGIRLRATDREKANLVFSFDHVIVATNANQVISLLEDAAQEEARVYSGFASQRARLVVHQDSQLMPADRATWGAYNYVVADDRVPGVRPTVTLYPNRLQSLSASIPDVFVTMNPFREPAADKIITSQLFVHPVVGETTDAAQRLDAMQGKRRTWFCGSYLREPFVHAQAYRCGVETAERLVEAIADESLKFEAGLSVSPGGFDDFLREIPMFADLDARALAEVQLVARPFQVEAGTMLFRQNDPPDGLYMIKRGEIAILRRIPGDELVKLADLGPSAVVGEMSLLDRNRRSTHAVAVKPTSGYFVSYERFQMLRSDYRPAAFAVMDCFRREMAARTRTILAQIAERTAAAEAPPAAPTGNGAAKWPAPSSPSTVDEGVIRSIPFFNTFRPAELRELLEPLKRYDFSRGQLVFAGGEAPRSCLLVVRGALSMNFSTPAAEASTFAVYGPGKMVGELALVDGRPHPLACMARESTIAFEVDRIGFELMRRGGSVVAFKFFEAVTSSIVGVLRKADAHLARISPQRPLQAASTSATPIIPTHSEPN